MSSSGKPGGSLPSSPTASGTWRQTAAPLLTASTTPASPQARDAATGIRDRQLDEALRETRDRLAEAEKAVAEVAAQLEAAR